jgi:hypothetical protein
MAGREYSTTEVSSFMQRVYHDARCAPAVRMIAQRLYFEHCAPASERDAFFSQQRQQRQQQRDEQPAQRRGRQQPPVAPKEPSGGQAWTNDGFYEKPVEQSGWRFSEKRSGEGLFQDGGPQSDSANARQPGTFQRGFVDQFMDHPSTAVKSNAQGWEGNLQNFAPLNLPDGDDLEAGGNASEQDTDFSSGFLSQFGGNTALPR